MEVLVLSNASFSLDFVVADVVVVVAVVDAVKEDDETVAILSCVGPLLTPLALCVYPQSC